MDRIENVYLESGITRIHVSRPRKNAPTLLFVHGGPGNPNRHKVFRRLRMLKRHFALAAYDAYGCGDSSHPKQLHVATLVTQLIEIAEYLKQTYPSPIILIGESFGSGICLLALEQRPDLFSSYIGYGQVYNRQDMTENQMDLFLEKLKTEGAYDRISYWKAHRKDLVSAKFDSVWYQRFYAEYYPLMEGDIPSYAIREIVPFQKSREYSQKAKSRQQRDNYRCTKRLFEEFFDFCRPISIPLPVFILAGKEDLVTPVDSQRKTFENILSPQKEFLELEGMGHIIPFDNPKWFASFLFEKFGK